MSGVIVKPLEWHKSNMPAWDGDWHTTTPVIYTVRCADENGWKWSFSGGHGYAWSPEAAQAAAQADYEARILSALEPGPVEPGQPITLTYTNWRGETAERTIIPQRLWFGSTQWHPEPGWLLAAIDMEKDAERDFALLGFGSGPAVNRIAALNAQIDTLAAELAALRSQVSALTEERDRLRVALAPFASLAQAYDPPEGDDDQYFWVVELSPTLGDLRRARAALSSKPEGE